jgi:hypothetical protein
MRVGGRLNEWVFPQCHPLMEVVTPAIRLNASRSSDLLWPEATPNCAYQGSILRQIPQMQLPEPPREYAKRRGGRAR